MLAKGDLKFRLDGKKLKGDFALVHIKSRRPGSKGTEWLLIKHRDDYVQPGYDIDKYDYSVLTKRTLDQIAGRRRLGGVEEQPQGLRRQADRRRTTGWPTPLPRLTRRRPKRRRKRRRVKDESQPVKRREGGTPEKKLAAADQPTSAKRGKKKLRVAPSAAKA